MSTDAPNIAKEIGFSSVGAAIIFTIAYVPLCGLFLFKSFTRPTYVHFILTLFCTIRIAAFGIRAALIKITSAGQNLNLFIADEILFGVGFFSLLYSAYTLVLDLEQISGRPESDNPIIRLTRNRKLFRLALTGGIALGIVAASSNNGSQTGSNATYHKISTVIFLVLTLLQAFQTVVLGKMERQARSQQPRDESMGARHATTILLLISLLLLVREAFATATVNSIHDQNKEHFWYPLSALPEILSVALFAIPGLVPDRAELQNPQRYPQDQHVVVQNGAELQGQEYPRPYLPNQHVPIPHRAEFQGQQDYPKAYSPNQQGFAPSRTEYQGQPGYSKGYPQQV